MERQFKWIVVGAGPSGVAAVGQILDSGIKPDDIAWVDPEFKVGDFGQYWKKVVSNTPVEAFVKFYKALESFQFNEPHPKFMIESLKSEARCPLGLAAEPLQWVSNQFSQKVHALRDTAINISYLSDGLQLHTTKGNKLNTNKVILAIGAEARTLPFPNLEVIPFKTAANPSLLNQVITSEDTVAIFGSYQSARTAAENIAKTNAYKVIHFYRSERSFDTHVASLELGENVERYQITPEVLLKHIPRCNKVIYTVGFERRHVQIEGLPNDYSYDYSNGKVAPGIYGLGIAFPEIIPHMMGREEYKVNALYPIMKHLTKSFPLWQQEPTPQLRQLNEAPKLAEIA